MMENFMVDVSDAENKIKIQRMTMGETCPQSKMMIKLKYEPEPLLNGNENPMSSTESIPCFGGNFNFVSNIIDQ